MVHLTDKPIFTIVPAEMWMSMHYIHLSIVMMSSAQSGSDERVRILVWNYYSIPSITSLECTSWILIEEVKMMKSKVISFGKEGELTWSDEEISRNLYSDLWIRQADLSIALKRPTATGEKSFLWSYVAVVSVVAVIVVVIWVVPESERICCLFYELTYVLAGHSPRMTEKWFFFKGSILERGWEQNKVWYFLWVPVYSHKDGNISTVSYQFLASECLWWLWYVLLICMVIRSRQCRKIQRRSFVRIFIGKAEISRIWMNTFQVWNVKWKVERSSTICSGEK